MKIGLFPFYLKLCVHMSHYYNPIQCQLRVDHTHFSKICSTITTSNYLEAHHSHNLTNLAQQNLDPYVSVVQEYQAKTIKIKNLNGSHVSHFKIFFVKYFKQTFQNFLDKGLIKVFIQHFFLPVLFYYIILCILFICIHIVLCTCLKLHW